MVAKGMFFGLVAGWTLACAAVLSAADAQVQAGHAVDSTDAALRAAGASQDWLLHGRTYDNQRFSPLAQITRKNVSGLAVVATLHTGVMNSFEATPIEVGGILYIVTATNHVQAYDAATGQKLWAWQPASLDYTEACCGPQARGVAVAYGKVFTALFDGHLVALDAKTGALQWETDPAKTHPAPKQYYTYTMAPQVYNGMVIVGTAGAEYETRGMLEAYDAKTGKKLWDFRTIPSPDQPGGDTWKGDAWKFGGGSVWNTPAVDTKRDLLVFSTGNPNPDYQGTTRPGNNAYTDSIVAIHAKDGTLAWWSQEVPHDMWDYDASAPVMLFDARDNDGKLVPAAGEAGKVGNVFVVNMLTGKLIRRSEPFVYQSPNIFTPPTVAGITISPGVNGGSLWQPPAYSPHTQDFYVLGSNIPMTFTAIGFKDSKPGGPWVGRHTGGVMKRADGVLSGTLTALSVDTGKVKWQYKSEQPLYGGVLATASDLLFIGEQNGDFDAFDARTGAKLWSHRFEMGICSPAITYSVKGVQYIAFGDNGCRGGHLPNGAPAFNDNFTIMALSAKLNR